MTATLLTPTGERATSSGPCMYQTTGGLFYAPEPPTLAHDELGDFLLFPPRRTVLVQAQATPKGLAFNCVRVDHIFTSPRDLFKVRVSALQWITDSADTVVLDKCAEALSSITLARGLPAASEAN